MEDAQFGNAFSASGAQYLTVERQIPAAAHSLLSPSLRAQGGNELLHQAQSDPIPICRGQRLLSVCNRLFANLTGIYAPPKHSMSDLPPVRASRSADPERAA